MDNSQLTTAGLTATFTALAGILYKIYTVVNHHRCRSRCCGKDISSSIDIEPTTPVGVVVPVESFENKPMTNQNGESVCTQSKT